MESSWAISNLKRWCCESAALSNARKFGKLSSGHSTGKGQFSFQFQRKEMPKNAQTTAQLHSSQTLVKYCSKFSKPGFSNTWTENFQVFKLVLEKQRNQRSNSQHVLIIEKAREFQKNIYFSFIDYAKAFDCVDHHKLWKVQKEMGISDYLTCLLRNLYEGHEATIRTGHGTTDWFQIGKGETVQEKLITRHGTEVKWKCNPAIRRAN